MWPLKKSRRYNLNMMFEESRQPVTTEGELHHLLRIISEYSSKVTIRKLSYLEPLEVAYAQAEVYIRDEDVARIDGESDQDVLEIIRDRLYLREEKRLRDGA